MILNLLLLYDTESVACAWLIIEPPDGCQPLGRLCDWSTGDKHKQKIICVECPLFNSYRLIRDNKHILKLKWKYDNIVKCIYFYFFLLVVSLYEYSLMHSRYHRSMSITIAQILLIFFYCPIDWLYFPNKIILWTK